MKWVIVFFQIIILALQFKGLADSITPATSIICNGLFAMIVITELSCKK